MFRVFIISLMGLVCTPAWATHQPSSDLDYVRITSAYAPERGEFEIYQVTDFLNDGPVKSAKTFTRFEYGVTDALVLDAVVPFRFKRPKGGAHVEGLGDLELEAKYRLVREPDFPLSLAAGLEVGFPTGNDDQGLGEGNFKYEPILAIGKIFGDVAIHQDAKLELIRETGGRGVEVEAGTTSAVAWTPVDTFGFIEHPTTFLALDWKFVEQQKTKLTLIPAIGGEIEGLPVELEWGLGLPVGLTRVADDWGIITSFEIEF